MFYNFLVSYGIIYYNRKQNNAPSISLNEPKHDRRRQES